MPVPPEARPLDHALERAYRDGLRGEEALLRALELVTIERGSDASRNLLAELRSLLEDQRPSLVLDPLALELARHEITDLAELTQAARLRRISLRRRLRGPAIGEALLERAREALPADPVASGRWAECALRALIHSDTHDPLEARQIAACTARAWAFWGNSCRAQCDLRRAEKLLDEAERTVDFHSVGDIATRAEIASFWGSLLRDQRQFEAAIESIEFAAAGWDLLGRTNQLARARLTLAAVHTAAGSAESALEALAAGVGFVAELRDQHLEWSFRHNEAWFLEELGRLSESRTVAQTARQLAADFPDSFTQLRVQWLEGRLCRSEGKPEEAITHFQAVQAGFLAEKNPYDAALVSLDLAALYLQLGRNADVVPLATAMGAAFESLGVHREALAAWRLFTDACQRQAANVQLAKNLARYLDQARHDPEFGFSAAGVLG
jgi:tetratricopeptide (TPR) repeat protein